jgi:hypothetical protein
MLSVCVHIKPNDLEHFSSHMIKAYQRQVRTTLPLFCLECSIDQTIQVEAVHFVHA